MADQILWINTLAAVAAGLVLLVVPKSSASLLGLPRTEQSFYPRMLGLTLLAIAGAAATQGYGRAGLGVDGMAAINLISGAGLVVIVLFGGLVLAKRGRWLLRGLALFWLILGGLGLLAS